VGDCLALPGTPLFLGLAGKQTQGVSLVGNDLSGAREIVRRTREVPATAYRLSN
jgi:hypothetical protein